MNPFANIDTPIVPDFFFVPFRDRKLLSDINLVLDQFEVLSVHRFVKEVSRLMICRFQKLLGESTLNGQALSISQENVWVHPADTHMLEENDPACDLISVELFKLFGDKTP